ncbi:MAG: hypothetical protein MUC69_03255 [Gemmatimonadales bacterium]|nr:hypothetical protein [Gemmatimonadales bacterium]
MQLGVGVRHFSTVSFSPKPSARMYRIRRSNGSEVTLASLDELAAAMASGSVTADAEIHHQRADRWLPIASHPHYRLAGDRAKALERPAPRTTPAPPAATPAAPKPQQPPLKLVRPDPAPAPDSAAPRTAPRWSPPVRPVTKPAPRPAGPQASSAAPALDATPDATLEFVVEAAPEAPAAAEAAIEPPTRPKRVEQATAGLPLLDVDEPAAVHPTPRPAAEPPAPQRPSMAIPAPVRESASVELVSTPPARPAPASFEPLASTQAESPVAVLHTLPPTIVPDARAVATLDLPPAVTDFTPIEVAAAAPQAKHPGWLMGAVAAVAVLAAIAFLALRPRSTTEPLDPARTPTTATRAAGTTATSAPRTTATPVATGEEAPRAARPSVTPDVPAAPRGATVSASAASSRQGGETSEAEAVVEAPLVPGFVPDAGLARGVSAPPLAIDPLATRKQQDLEATRQKIDSQMRQPVKEDE